MAPPEDSAAAAPAEVAVAAEVDDLARASGGSKASHRSQHGVNYSQNDVRVLDLLAPHRDTPVEKVRGFLQALDIWDLRSFVHQAPRERAWNAATRIMPCLTWMTRADAPRSYKWREQLIPDLAAGIAVSCLIIPQGLSYANVAGLPAIYGLYTDFVPVFIYFVFGSSMYLQVGAVSVVSLLTNTCIQQITQAATANVAALKKAASSALASYYTQQSNPALYVIYQRSQSAYVAADAALIQNQIATANLLAFYVGIFSFGIGFLKLGSVMNFMGPAVISGFSTAAAITIGLGQCKNLFGYGKDFIGTYPQSTELNLLIQSMRHWHGELSWTATWNGLLWIGVLLIFKYLGRVNYTVRGLRVFRLFKITGPIVVVVVAILSTKFGKLYLSPKCDYYDPTAGVSNIYVQWADPAHYGPGNPFFPARRAASRPGCNWLTRCAGQNAVANVTQAWAMSPANAAVFPQAPTVTANFLGQVVSYSPQPDNPGCVPMPKAYAVATAAKPVGYEWPKWRGLSIVGTFGNPPKGKSLDYGLISDTTGKQILTQAIVITLVASLESVAIAKRLAVKHKQADLDPSREALGIANFFGSFTGSYPISGSFSRSALNDEVGATSPVAVLVVATLVGVILAIATFTPIFFYLPQTVLSAIVIVSLLTLLDFDRFFWLLRHDRKDAGLWMAAFFGVLFAGVEVGILIAVCISLAFVVAEFVMAPMQEMGIVHGNTRRSFRPLKQYPEAQRIPGLVILKAESAIVFANAGAICAHLRALVYGSDASGFAREKGAHPGTRAVILDLSSVSYVDTAFLSGFDEVLDSYAQAGVLMVISNPNTNVLHKLTITPLLDKINSQFGEQRDWVFLTITDAVEAVSSFEPPVKAVKAGDDGQDDLPDGDERALHSHPAPQPEDSEAVSM